MCALCVLLGAVANNILAASTVIRPYMHPNMVVQVDQHSRDVMLKSGQRQSKYMYTVHRHV